MRIRITYYLVIHAFICLLILWHLYLYLSHLLSRIWMNFMLKSLSNLLYLTYS